ncbi:glycoside hydrolase family 3 C-terminal domain-containing protein [Alistipes sp. kh20]|uniref:glycoside hydrolase family 3 N-terminal domain-containing protein n=1 Tax=Alistipes montrealensis TaxID=2834113 RepID=UPI001BCA7AC0|nr:glycoside hydrolase family 3 N-terminal domain-containing protein [Alistipes montrealensis]MBS4764718.1 glycoside hydrolase family 3 C-terminal domain-containing protein [Alistipes montrealensis]
MKAAKQWRLTAVLAAVTFGGCTGPVGYDDTDRKVDSLLKQMTLDEKIGQMSQFSCNWDVTGAIMPDDYRKYLRKGMVGSILNGYTVAGIRRLQSEALEHSRLKIPVLFGYDVVHGYRTIFPIPLGESCTWDPELMRQSAAIAAEEAAAGGINWTFAPMVDITRDPRWGRVMEGAGEDPYLGSLIARARVEGFQGGDLGSTKTVLACTKHFAAYGAAEAGRDYNTTDMSEHTLREVYLPPFRATVEAGVGSLMASFNEIGGIPATANRHLMTDILRGEWGFGGVLVSDYTGINELVPHGIAADEKEAGEKALNAGIDMDMTGAVYLKYLRRSLDEGRVSLRQIDDAVRRILRQKFLLGLFDDPYRYLDSLRERETLGKPEFRAKAREIAVRSIVLLKNDGGVLPLDPSSRMTVALVGPMVSERASLNGAWAGSGVREESVTLLEGLTKRYAGTAVRFITAAGCDLTTDDRSGFAEAVTAARRADIVVAAMGEHYDWSGETASRSDITLPGAQRDLLRALEATGKPVVLVVLSGRPLDLSWEHAHLKAIVEAWYPGTTAGDAITDVLSGDYNPSGKLTMSFPRSAGQIPVYYNHKNTGRPAAPGQTGRCYRSNYLDIVNEPLYAFGHGLSYTTFEISEPTLDRDTFSAGGRITASARVSNTGGRDGEVVIQLYIRDVAASVTRPVKELKGFRKIALRKGEVQTVTFEVSEREIAFLNADFVRRPEAGEFRLWIAQSSDDDGRPATFHYE